MALKSVQNCNTILFSLEMELLSKSKYKSPKCYCRRNNPTQKYKNDILKHRSSVMKLDSLITHVYYYVHNTLLFDTQAFYIYLTQVKKVAKLAKNVM